MLDASTCYVQFINVLFNYSFGEFFFFNMKKDFIIFRCFVKEHVIFTPTTPDGIHV